MEPMKHNTPCPDADRLKGLLDSSLSQEEQSALVGHLDDCAGCQHSLEELAVGGEPVAEAVREAERGRPAADSAYWKALRDLQRDTDPDRTRAEADAPPQDDELSLHFLQPSEDPQYLGRLGHFEIAEVIGRGGMGIVLRAFDPCLQRSVALKVLDPEVADNEVARKRFCREARAAAAVTHENVVAIHQVDEEEIRELPFLVMQLVTGTSLQERLDGGKPLPLKDILRIGAQAAAGLAAAHTQGLIHRDIKPANILLESGTDRVKLTDFGLARAAEDVKLTQTGFVAGTPLYMAPEQARGEPVDHRADLFSLGSVLYTLCTGKPPFEGNTPFIVLRQVTEEFARPIQELNPAISDWLVEAIDRLHAKDPAERFQSAAEVAELFSEHLARLQQSTPVQTTVAPSRRTIRPSARREWWRGGQFWFLAALLPLACLGALFVSEWAGMTRLLGRTAVPAPEADSPPPRGVLNGNAGPVWSVAFSPDGKSLAMGIDDGTVKIWNPVSGEVRLTLHAHAGPVWSLAFSHDGKLLATASDDGAVKLWEVATGEEFKKLDVATAVRAVAFSPDGKTLATGSRNGEVRLWMVATGCEAEKLLGHTGVIVAVAFSPDGKTLASASGDKTVKLWDAATGRERLTLRGHLGGVYAVAFSPDGKTVASGSWDKSVRLWDAASGEERATLSGHSQDVWAVAFAPDGKTLASASEDRTVKLWDVPGKRERVTFRGHTGTLYSVAFARDGRTVVSAGRDGTARLWDPEARAGGPE
jgi:serine/threonine protein kinase/Tol biopolymer transport system component